MPTISACLIVRDEERFLEGCLQSIAGQVSETVVVDTGSADRTVEIAKDFGAHVLTQPWRQDFAAARNVGLAAATGAWILYIDADERLRLPPGRRLDDGLGQDGAIAARTLFHPRVNTTPYREYRLFRNDPRIRFRGAIHETIRPDIHALAGTGAAAILDVAAAIIHLGYEGDLSAKHARNLPLLRDGVARDPTRLYYWHHLAETLAATGDRSGAIAACRSGLEIAARLRDGAQAASAAAIAVTLADLLRASGEDALATIDAALADFPDHKALLLLRARALIDRHECVPALALLAALTAIDSASYCDPRVSYDCRIFGAYAHDLVGVACLRLGDRPGAAAAFARAAAHEPSDPSYRRKAEALGAMALT